jgi:hypothetical protein
MLVLSRWHNTAIERLEQAIVIVVEQDRCYSTKERMEEKHEQRVDVKNDGLN